MDWRIREARKLIQRASERRSAKDTGFHRFTVGRFTCTTVSDGTYSCSSHAFVENGRVNRVRFRPAAVRRDLEAAVRTCRLRGNRGVSMPANLRYCFAAIAQTQRDEPEPTG